MIDHGFYYDLNQFQATRTARHWWFKALVVCAVLGGVYGAAVGAAIGGVPGAADIIEIAAAVNAG